VLQFSPPEAAPMDFWTNSVNSLDALLPKVWTKHWHLGVHKRNCQWWRPRLQICTKLKEYFPLSVVILASFMFCRCDVCFLPVKITDYEIFTTTTTPQPFYGPFSGLPAWASAKRQLLDFMMQEKINRGRHTDHPAGRHSIRTSWLRGPAVEHRSLAGVLSLSCARPVADGWPLMWVNHLL